MKNRQLYEYGTSDKHSYNESDDSLKMRDIMNEMLKILKKDEEIEQRWDLQRDETMIYANRDKNPPKSKMGVQCFLMKWPNTGEVEVFDTAIPNANGLMDSRDLETLEDKIEEHRKRVFE